MSVLSQVEEQDVTLRGKEKMRVSLKLCGLRDSKFEIKGINWRLEGLAPGYRALQMRSLPQPRARYNLPRFTGHTEKA